MLLGDSIAAVTKAAGIKPCAPCQRRQQKLNAAHQTVKSILSKPKSMKEMRNGQ